MAAKKSTGITATMIKFGGGISAARALPKSKGKRPAVIILHERYGVDQHTKDLTAKLAQAGFVGLAPDLFHRFTGDRKALLRGEQRVDLTDDGALADLNAAVEYLKRLKEVDGRASASLASVRPAASRCCWRPGATISPAPWYSTAQSVGANGKATTCGRRPSTS